MSNYLAWAVVGLLAPAAPTWQVVPTVDPSNSTSLNAVSARTATDAWAVGFVQLPGDDLGKAMLTERWDGTRWRPVATPNIPRVDEKLLAVSATGPNDAWAVGSMNPIGAATTNPIAAHWDGKAWTIVPTAAASGGSKSILDGVVTFSPTNAWAVGRSKSARALVEQWNGTAWTAVPVPDPVLPAGQTLASSMLTGISAISPTDIWAVGSYSLGGTALTGLSLTMHYNGVAWSVVKSPNVTGGTRFNPARTVLNSVTAIAPNDVWAVGNTFTTDGTNEPDAAVSMHWNGTAWSFAKTPSVLSHDVLTSVTALAANDVWAAGYRDDVTGSIPVRVSLTEHWDGTTWSVVASPNGPTGVDTSLFGASALASSGEVWAVGAVGARTFALHHTG